VGDRVPVDPGGAEFGDYPPLDEFDDIGDWEPIHRPLFKATAVVLSLSLVLAALSTVADLLFSGH
jgi:hypothetical protein